MASLLPTPVSPSSPARVSLSAPHSSAVRHYTRPAAASTTKRAAATTTTVSKAPRTTPVPKKTPSSTPASTFDKSGCLFAQRQTVDAVKAVYTAEEPISNDTTSYYIQRVGNAMERADNSLFGVGEHCAPSSPDQHTFSYGVAQVQDKLANIARQINDVTNYQTVISDWSGAVRSDLAPLFSRIDKYSWGPTIPTA